MHFLIHM